jgi:ABC-type nitrate/sulfonate/bicarbonate transport system permease component
LGEWGKVLYVALGCFFIIVVVSSEAIRNVNRLYIWAGQALGCHKGGIYRRVILPSIIPGIIGGLRIAITTAFPFCIAAEFLGAQKGLGSYLIKAEVHLIISKMIAGVIAITVLVIVFDKGMSRFVGRFTEWSERGE